MTAPAAGRRMITFRRWRFWFFGFVLLVISLNVVGMIARDPLVTWIGVGAGALFFTMIGWDLWQLRRERVQ